jgi:uncharacterized protein YdeI (YjbR/CyaY-like superfamily)
MTNEPDAIFFKSPADLRRWFENHHGKATVVWIAFWKAGSGRKGITYDEAVEESLCFGWIDGLVRRLDAHAYQQRFTPRKPRSIWSAVNIRKAEALKKAGRMAKPGLDTFEGRDRTKAGLYSFENRHVTLSPEFEKRFRARKAAWKFFEAQPPGYRRLAAFWVMSAKKEETRERRFAKLIDDSAGGVRVGAITGEKSPSR